MPKLMLLSISECPREAKFLISVNSEIVSISLASDEM